jgi:hypothetical protein
MSINNKLPVGTASREEGPDPKQLRPFLLPLFTGVRGIEILRTSP